MIIYFLPLFLFMLHVRHPDNQYQLVWADEFDGTELDTKKWNVQTGDGCDISLCGWGNNELEWYTNQPENLQVRDGKLVITARKTAGRTKPYTSARINTRYKGDWTYGRIEARIRLPEGKGLWPAFWMLPTDWKFGSWPDSGEIDIMELTGDNPSVVHGTIHTGPPHKSYSGKHMLVSGKFPDQFHVFAIEWTEKGITWFVDGQPFHKVKAKKVEVWSPFRERFHILLNLAVGGNWPGPPDNTTEFPQSMEVDYVRVYQ